MLNIRPVVGPEAQAFLPALARLRIDVFADWPYCYQGDLDYEQHYLETYARSPRSVFVLALDGSTVVGCATGVPLAEEPDYCREPFERAGMAVGDVFYFGESVLNPAYRGQGVGHQFFDAREAHARSLGFGTTAFCAVVRRDDDPRRPPGARSLEPFWRARGYRPIAGLTAQFSWREHGDIEATSKEMQFWLRAN